MRNSLAVNFPGSQLVGTGVLTPAFLSTVKAVMLDPVAAAGTNITPLSNDEKSALFNFVQNGGGAILVADSYNPAAAQNLVDAFGLQVTGLTPGRDNGSIPNPSASPVINGPFGQVTQFVTDEGYWFSNLGPYAHPVAYYASNDQPSIAVIDRGAIGPHSGPVVILGDINAFGDAELNYLFDSNQMLFLNTVAFAVPEPSTLMLATVGSTCLGAVMFRRSRRSP